MSEVPTRTGGCLCGKVRFELSETPKEYAACHCAACRTLGGGGPAMSVMVLPNGLSWAQDDALKAYKSSDWAERGFCETCGSTLFWKLTAPSPMQGMMYLSVAALDSMEGIPFTSEIFIDHKPDSYAFEGDRRRLTQAQVMAMEAGDA